MIKNKKVNEKEIIPPVDLKEIKRLFELYEEQNSSPQKDSNPRPVAFAASGFSPEKIRGNRSTELSYEGSLSFSFSPCSLWQDGQTMRLLPFLSLTYVPIGFFKNVSSTCLPHIAHFTAL